MKNRISIGFFIYICLSACLPAADIERVIDNSFDTVKGETLNLKTDIGSVEISTHALNEVLVKILLRTNTSNKLKAEEIIDNFKLSFDDTGDIVNIKGEFLDRRFWWNNRLDVRFTIVVPEEYNLTIMTAGGNIKITDIQGLVDLNTSGGNITMGKITGMAHARTSGGNITLAGATGGGDAHTSGGRIHIGNVSGDFTTTTSGGSIEVDGAEGSLMASTSGGSLHFRNIRGNLVGKTSGGPIQAEFSAQADKRVELRTSGGGITLSVPADFRANLEASTSGGHVYTDLPVTVQGKITESSLTGLVNNGGPGVVLHTSGGNIEIRKTVN